MIKKSVFKRKAGAEGEEESSRSRVAKTPAPRPAVNPAPFSKVSSFFKSVWQRKTLQAQKRQIGGKTERKTEARRREHERKPGEGILKA